MTYYGTGSVSDGEFTVTTEDPHWPDVGVNLEITAGVTTTIFILNKTEAKEIARHLLAASTLATD